MIRVFHADDHPVVTAGLRAALDAAPNMTSVGHASDASNLASLVQGAKADVLVLDLHMPGVTGPATIAELAGEGIAIVLFSLYAEGALSAEMLRAGARATVSKDRPMDYLLAAIRRVADGQIIAASMRAQAPHLDLSQREREIFDAMLSGKALKVIALDLELSASTVHTYARRIRGKLGAETNADVVRYAHAAGLITNPH